MRNVVGTFTVNVDVDIDGTDTPDEITDQVRDTMLNLLSDPRTEVQVDNEDDYRPPATDVFVVAWTGGHEDPAFHIVSDYSLAKLKFDEWVSEHGATDSVHLIKYEPHTGAVTLLEDV